MAKRKRKIGAAQRDRAAISTAKYLKGIGALSPQTKLHGGKFISRGVLKKVRDLQALESKHYTTVKASKAVAERAREQGFQVLRGNRIVTPRDRRYKRAILEGRAAGVVPLRSGIMEVIPLPSEVDDMQKLIERLESGEGIEDLKAPGEVFAFQFFGNMSYRTFRDSEDLLEKLREYKSIFDGFGRVRSKDLTEEFQGLALFRLNPNDATRFIPTSEQRRQARRNLGADGRRPRPTKRIADMHPTKAAHVRERERQKSATRRAKKTPEQKARDRETAKARMKSYRQRLKQEE